ncbi:hypothetical protein D9M68_715900 [compost metagenome]
MNVVLIGSGNVATHLAKALKASGVQILQVWSKHFIHAEALASVTGARPIQHLSEIQTDADLCILSIKDDAITAVANELSHFKGTMVHTSGAVPIAVFKGMFSHYGVFYPLQTFSKGREIDFDTVPLCIEANDPETLQMLLDLGEQLSSRVSEVNSEKRRILHLAAVFACNFPNHLYALAAGLLGEYHLNFDLLRPLILETALKVQHADPQTVQTGPAIRFDEQSLEKHKALLSGDEHLKKIYQLLSESIKKTKK